MSWLGSWWGAKDRNNVAAAVFNGSNFFLGFHLQVEVGGALLAVLSSYLANIQSKKNRLLLWACR
jgi:hypothetical protein